MKRLQLGRLYPITSAENAHGLNHVELSRLFLSQGIGFFQVREKKLPDREYLQQLKQVRHLCDQVGAQFVVNDRADLAPASAADGVHLGQADLPVEEARRVLGRQAIIGISTHNRHQFESARHFLVDYIALGPIFKTTTKRSEYRPLSCELIRTLCRSTDKPVVAIGGINLERAPQVWASGADSVAVISDIVNNTNPGARVQQYLRLAEEFDGKR